MQNNAVYLETRGEVASLVLNRPDKLNALNSEVLERIKAATAEVADNPEVKVMIVRGATAKVFSSGADISEFPKVHATPESRERFNELFRSTLDGITGLEKPVIAMIAGYCFGGAAPWLWPATCATPTTPPGSAFHRPGSAWPTPCTKPNAWSIWSARQKPRKC